MNVELLNHMGDDEMVANCARVSYAKEASNYTLEQNERLINYLAREWHIAPFYHPKLQFRIQVPIYVERQLTKTSVGVNLNNEIDADINSISGRYVDFSDSYTQIELGDWRLQSKDSKQGSAGLADKEVQTECDLLQNHINNVCRMGYDRMVKMGISKEQARTILPLNLNTEFIWTGSLWALIRLCQLRLAPDAQKETGDPVRLMLDAVKNIPGEPFKYSLKAFGL